MDQSGVVSNSSVQEIYGSHYELPELGPLGSNGMALLRDFEHPIASFDLDTTEWESECANSDCAEQEPLTPRSCV
jgi:homogentisate 1,2-dioxygenase